MENEIWKDIENWPNYMVSDLGRVKSLNYSRTGEERILKCWTNQTGYLRVGLWKDGTKKNCLVHQLVAKAFIPNPNNWTCINHLDRNRTNNVVSNLEWTTHHLNNSYHPTLEYKSKVMTNRSDMSKPVLQLTKEGWLLNEWPSLHEIERQLGYCHSIIGECCRGNGRRKSAYGFKWVYKEKAA